MAASEIEAQRAEIERLRALLMRQPSIPAESADAAAEATTVAAIIFHDMFTIGLSAQRERLGLGLVSALPLSTLDAADAAHPVLAPELLAYEGSFESFSRALDFSVAGRAQTHHFVALAQTTGSGKTKLAYAEGMARSLVIFVRVAVERGDFARPWQVYLGVARALESARLRADPHEKRRISETALAALRLLVACYAEWVALVLRAFHKMLPPGDAVASDGADSVSGSLRNQYIREAALRCLRNNRGDNAVAALFEYRLVQLAVPASAGSDGAVSGCMQLNGDHVKAHFTRVAQMLQEQLWAYASVVVWYDDVHELLGHDEGVPATPLVFMRIGDYAVGASERPARDVFYGLTALMGSLLEWPLFWRQVMCAPWLHLASRVQLNEYSCVHDRVHALHHASVMDVTTMMRSLQRYLPVPALPDATVKHLQALCGRPKWFFDTFWPELWSRVGAAVDWHATEPARDPLTPEALLTHIALAAETAVTKVRSLAESMVMRAWSEPGDRRSVFCAELYAAIKLNNGRVTLKVQSAMNDAVRYGLMAVHRDPERSSAVAELLSEPCIVAALESIGDAVVRGHVSDDPVFQLLQSEMCGGTVRTFGLTSSVTGPVLQLFVVWHMLRTRICAGDSVTLSQVLVPFVHRDCLAHATQQLLLRNVVTATRARKLPSVDGVSCAELRHLAVGDVDVVLYDIDTYAGVDVAFAVQCPDSGNRTPVFIQAKEMQEASLADCLRASTPAWQYSTHPQRAGLLQGAPCVPNTIKRHAFEALAAEHAAFFNRAVRVAFCVNDFAIKSVRACKGVNEHITATMHSPVVLCSINHVAGHANVPAALAALVDSCKDEEVSHAVAHPSKPHLQAFWAPLTVAQVAAAQRAQAAIADDLISALLPAAEVLAGEAAPSAAEAM